MKQNSEELGYQENNYEEAITTVQTKDWEHFSIRRQREVVSHRLGFLEGDAETEFEVQDIY